MKGERRHELKDNDLAQYIDAGRNYLNEHGTRLGLAAIAVVAVVIATGVTVRSRASAREEAWQRRLGLTFADIEEGKRSLETLRELTRGTDQVGFAVDGLLDQGRHGLRLAQQTENPPDPELNSLAREAFERLLADFADNPLAFGAAHCGLATVEENDFALDHDPTHQERARFHLQAIVDSAAMANLPFYRLAFERLDGLDQVFSVVRFEPALPPEEALADEAPAGQAPKMPPLPKSISPDSVRTEMLKKVTIGEDGKITFVDDEEK